MGGGGGGGGVERERESDNNTTLPSAGVGRKGFCGRFNRRREVCTVTGTQLRFVLCR